MSNPLLYIEPAINKSIYWQDIVSLARKESEYNPSKHCKTFSEVFIQLLKSLVFDQPIVLYDTDLSESELASLSSDNKQTYLSAKLDHLPTSFDSFLLSLNKLENWSIRLYTSGTTGQPKSVEHSFDSITRGVKTKEQYKNHIWGWAYNPTHMAGVQVFFQALLNRNPLIMLFNLSRETALHCIRKYNITHISATPTFFRLLQPLDVSFLSLQTITFGGERIDKRLISYYQKHLPHVRIRNIYASTEAGSLFVSQGDWFRVPERIRELVRVQQDELWLHSSLLGKGDQLAAIKEWYPTGDLVEVSDQDPLCFRFLSRNNEMINVGGYKVNPHDVEEAVNSYPGVMHSRVYGKKNAILGNIVMADVICSDTPVTETEIRQHLSSLLQDYKIPRMIRFVDKIDKTRSGKNLRV